MPAPLKGALVREAARRTSNVNDVAVGILAEEFGVSYIPTGRRRKVLAGGSPVLLLRIPPEPKDAIHAEASRRGSNANDVILAALADGLGVPAQSNRKGRKLMAATNGSKNGARAKDEVRVAIIGVGNCANSLLQGVEYYKDAKPEDSVPGLMHVDLGGYHNSDIEVPAAVDAVKGKGGVAHRGRRVHRSVRRGQGQGRSRPRRGDLGASERHDQVRGRAQDRHQGL